MSNLIYVKFERIMLKGHAEYNETWVQSRIAEDPSILGLGELLLKDKERTQPKGGAARHTFAGSRVSPAL